MATATLNAPQVLTANQLEQYREEGYFVVEDVFDSEEVQQMLDECESILRGDFGELYDGATQQDPGSTEVVQKARKVSAVVERNLVFRKCLLKDELMRRVQDILGPDIFVFRDILMLKPAQVGSKMPWHQDSNYWPIEPKELCSVWTALDAATLENGCMRVVPGSHKMDLIRSRSERGDGPLEDDQIDLAKAIDVPMAPGSSLFFHSRLLHGSEPNSSDKPRRAFITSFMSAQSKLTPQAGIRNRYFLASGRSYPGCICE